MTKMKYKILPKFTKNTRIYFKKFLCSTASIRKSLKQVLVGYKTFKPLKDFPNMRVDDCSFQGFSLRCSGQLM